MAWSESDPSDDPQQTMTLFPAGTTFFEPNDINEVSIMFPDKDSAIVFYQWCMELCSGSVSGDDSDKDEDN